MKIGDLVSVIDDNLKGTVTAVKGKRVVMEDEHGFPYEYDSSELVLQQAEIYDKVKIVLKEEAPKPISKKHNKKPVVLDLHFEKLVNNTAGYDSAERLFLQKRELLNKIDYCRKNNKKVLEIIHGIGDGILQQMVHEVLESQTNIEFQNKEILHHQSGIVLVYFR